ncbi:MAG: substrate-binding domain-containing protein [Trueperaceae bacterium]|nr:substrate-binding domain-containing protein [Trueperaceae bacterium]MCO5173423.1 substrate-binding domain-containing protein [Trueperaceae bacterium]MCW5819259.1 substrate-binding domain-containing protein [Trueperaceae bacterium]HNQ98723.1 substrate-binding domain-containing protein [Trueperaceae bacterium]
MQVSMLSSWRLARLALLGLVLGSLAWAQDASSLAVDSFTSDFSAMQALTGLAAQGQGKIGVLLPETTTSARYTAFDEPFLKQAFHAAGVPDADVIVTNAQGSESTQLTQAQAAITQGATVLLVDPISSGVGASIEQYALDHGVKVIDYDRLTLGGSRAYYVSFDNVQVGKLIGDGFVSCVQAWNVSDPHVLIMNGAPTDNNATLFAQGYHSVIDPLVSAGTYTLVGEPAGTWDPAQARTTFEGQYTAHSDINAVVTPNDDNANAVIAYLKTLGVPAKTFPTTGQDATVQGLQNVLAGYQCGTVYKPINLEAQAAAALAVFLRAGVTPPETLVNGVTRDSEAGSDVQSVLLTPIWVTPANMAATVVKDGFQKAADLCAGFADECGAAGIGQ